MYIHELELSDSCDLTIIATVNDNRYHFDSKYTIVLKCAISQVNKIYILVVVQISH